MAVRWIEYALSEYASVLAEREELEAAPGDKDPITSSSGATSEDDALLSALEKLWRVSSGVSRRALVFLRSSGARLWRGTNTEEYWIQTGWYSLRAGLLAYGVKTALLLLPQLFRGRIRTLSGLLSRKLWFPADTLRLSGFFGGFVLLHAVGERLRLPAWVSGFGAGLLLGVAPRSSRLPIALFGFVRAVEVFGRWLSAEGYLPWFQHGDTALMVAASIQCVYAWIYEPQSLDPSYLSFLYKFGRHPIPIVEAVCANTRGLPVREDVVLPLLQRRGLCTDWEDPKFCVPRGGHWCQLAHPDSTNCTLSYLRFWLGSFRQSIGLYTPVFLLPFILSLTQRLRSKPRSDSEPSRGRHASPVAAAEEESDLPSGKKKDGTAKPARRKASAAAFLRAQEQAAELGPLQKLHSQLLRPELHSLSGHVGFPRFLLSHLARLCLSVTRSAVFLATYCSNGWGSVCFYRAVRGSVHPSAGVWSGLCCGLSVLLEAPSRRVELGLYVMMHALQSIGNLSLPRILRMLRWDPGRPVPLLLQGPQFAVLLFAISSSFLRVFLHVRKSRRKPFRISSFLGGKKKKKEESSSAASAAAAVMKNHEADSSLDQVIVVRSTTSRLLQFLFATPTSHKSRN